jgi:hypothetical protein
VLILVVVGGFRAVGAQGATPEANGMVAEEKVREFAARLAEKLGLDTSRVEAATRETGLELFDERTAEFRERTESGEPIGGRWPFDGAPGRTPRGFGLRIGGGHFEDDLATFLVLTFDEVHSEFRSGRWTLEIAEEQGKTEADLDAFLNEQAAAWAESFLDDTATEEAEPATESMPAV